MANMRSQNKELLAVLRGQKGWLAVWLVEGGWLLVLMVEGGLVGWSKDRGWLHHTPLHKGNLPSSFSWKIRLQMLHIEGIRDV